jgi:hypothetical protein
MNFDKNYLGHDFEIHIWEDVYFNIGRDYMCKKCKVIVEYNKLITNCEYRELLYKDKRINVMFNLNCDEVIIKSIIE